MNARNRALATMALVGVFCAACGASAPSRFYTLGSGAKPDGAAPASYGVIVGEVSVPAVVDRPQFVVQVAPNRVEIDEFNRWAAPLGTAIADVIAADLAGILGTPNVATASQTRFDATYRVAVDIQRFDSIPGEAVQVEAVWAVTKIASGQTRAGGTNARERVQTTGYDELAAAHSRALAQLSRDIAKEIRAFAAAGAR